MVVVVTAVGFLHALMIAVVLVLVVVIVGVSVVVKTAVVGVVGVMRA